MRKTLNRAVTFAAVLVIALVIIGEIENQLSSCPNEQLKVRLADGSVGCVNGSRLNGIVRNILR